MVFTSFEWQQQVEPAAPHTHFGVVLFHESERFPRSPASKEKRSRWVEASEKQAAAVCRRAHYVRKKPSLIHTHTHVLREGVPARFFFSSDKSTRAAHIFASFRIGCEKKGPSVFEQVCAPGWFGFCWVCFEPSTFENMLRARSEWMWCASETRRIYI